MGLEAGVDVRIVSARLGHASASFTASTYQHVIDKLDQDAAERLVGAIWGGRP